jgi:hypothetical protein
VNRYNGPALARWLDEQPETRGLDDSRRRVIRHWSAGIDPTESAVDAFLCSLGIHLREVPAHAVLGWPEVSVRGLEIDWHSDGTRYLRRVA